MKVDLRSLGGHLASLAWVALRSFLATVAVFTLLGVILAAVSYYALSEHHPLYGTVAVAVALVEAVTAGIVLGGKRAIVAALAYGLGTLRLGGSLVRLVFERMLGVVEGTAVGEYGGRIAQGLQRLPLAQVEEMLRSAVHQVTGNVEQGGWLRRKIQARLLEAVGKYTLARFREEGARQGGVDLWRVKDELEQTVDDVLVAKVRGGLRLWTTLVILGLPLLVAVQTWVILLLLRSRG